MLEIVQGNIFDFPADGLAIPSNNQLGLGSGLREQAYKYFKSQDLSQVCHSYMIKQNKSYLDDCLVVVTQIKHQNFKYLFHCVTPFRKYDKNTKKIDKLYENLFIEISKFPISSITLTSIGGGLAGWSLDEVLNSFCLAFTTHREAIQNIKFNFVVFEKDCLPFIKDYLKTNIGQYTLQESKILPQPQAVQFRQNQINYNQTQQQQQQQQQQRQQNPTQSNLQKIENFDKGWRMNMNDNFQEQNPDQNLERGQIEQNQNFQSQNEYPNKPNNRQKEFVQQQQNNNYQQFQSMKQEVNSNYLDDDEFTEIKTKKKDNKIPTQVNLEKQKEEEKYYISLVFVIDQNLRIDQNSIDDFIKQILEICKFVFYVHQQVLKGDFNKYYNQDGILLKYHVTQISSEIQEWVSPEMLESYYVSELQDSYTLGKIMLFFLRLKIPFTENDSYKKQEIQNILEKLQSPQTSSRLRIDQVMIKLISMINDEQYQMNWNQLMEQIQLFYKNEKNLDTICQQKIEYVKKFTFKKVEQKESSILVKSNSSNENTVKSLLENQIFQSDQKQSNVTQYNQAIECIVIPVDKFNFHNSLPFQIHLKKEIQQLFDQIIELAQKDKEHFLQEAKITIPEFQNESILFVFCPCTNNDGRKFSLKQCYQDIFLYAFKCLKVKSICINHIDIFNKLITEKSDIKFDQVNKIFQESLSFTETETLIRRDTQIKKIDWTILKMPIKQLISKNLSVQIYKQDITQLKGVEAIVNTANEYLSNGGGACGAIFRAADAQKLENEIFNQFQDKYGKKIQVSEVFVSGSHNLYYNNGPKHILHAVGPIYSQNNPQTSEQLLGSCIINILKECERLEIKSIAIPPISAGIFGYPVQKCAQVFKKTLLQYPFKYPMQIHIVDILDDIINTFKFIFSGEKIKDIIHGVIENLQDTECLIVPLDIKNIDSKFNIRLFKLAGESLKNDLQLKIENYVQDYTENEIFGQTYHCQAFKLKFKQVYNIMFVTSPKKENLDIKEWYQYFEQILKEAFVKKGYSSITICLYLFILMILQIEEIPAFDQTRIIKVFYDVVESLKKKFYESQKLVKIGKIAIFSNSCNFIEECKSIFQ